MERVKVKEIFRNKEEYLGKEINVAGWIRQNRELCRNRKVKYQFKYCS